MATRYASTVARALHHHNEIEIRRILKGLVALSEDKPEEFVKVAYNETMIRELTTYMDTATSSEVVLWSLRVLLGAALFRNVCYTLLGIITVDRLLALMLNPSYETSVLQLVAQLSSSCGQIREAFHKQGFAATLLNKVLGPCNLQVHEASCDAIIALTKHYLYAGQGGTGDTKRSYKFRRELGTAQHLDSIVAEIQRLSALKDEESTRRLIGVTSVLASLCKFRGVRDALAAHDGTQTLSRTLYTLACERPPQPEDDMPQATVLWEAQAVACLFWAQACRSVAWQTRFFDFVASTPVATLRALLMKTSDAAPAALDHDHDHDHSTTTGESQTLDARQQMDFVFHTFSEPHLLYPCAILVCNLADNRERHPPMLSRELLRYVFAMKKANPRNTANFLNKMCQNRANRDDLTKWGVIRALFVILQEAYQLDQTEEDAARKGERPPDHCFCRVCELSPNSSAVKVYYY